MKKLLFVTQQLGCGGVEKALANVFQLIDREKYECTLLVFDASGEFAELIPDHVKIIEYKCPAYIKTFITKFYFKGAENFSENIYWHWQLLVHKFIGKLVHKNYIFRVIHKKCTLNNNLNEYDAIIDFHGYGTFTTYLTAMYPSNAKKISWIHEETIYGAYSAISQCYKKFDHIFGCSKDCCKNFIKKFPKCKEKVSAYYNYLDTNEVVNKSKEYIDESLFADAEFKIVSVGRICEQKKFERAIETAEILKRQSYKFKWLIVGDGEQLEDLRKKVIQKRLEDEIQFIGFFANPYAVMSKAHLYVQTSRAEGFCTTITEALVLGLPVVSTRVGGIEEQLESDSCGIITEHSGESLAEAIKMLIEDKELLRKKAEYAKNKEFHFEKEIEKLYKVIE